MMMTNASSCGDFGGMIARAADGALADSDRARLDVHLDACPACRDALAAQVETRALLAARLPVEASPAFRVRVRQAIERDATPGGLAELLDFRRWTWRLAPVAGAMALAAMLGISAQVPVSEPDAAVMTASAADLPVSAALFSTNVSDESMLSLMLRASVDDTLGSIDAAGVER
jgi:anti-sigma factor RsiW